MYYTQYFDMEGVVVKLFETRNWQDDTPPAPAVESRYRFAADYGLLDQLACREMKVKDRIH